jgi:hypothetical protein
LLPACDRRHGPQERDPQPGQDMPIGGMALADWVTPSYCAIPRPAGPPGVRGRAG